MNRISSFSIIVIFILFTLVGLALFKSLNLQLNPTRSLSSITVRYSWPGNEAKVVEQEVTSKLESTFARILGVKYINSGSYNGSGYIWLSLDKEADVDAVRFEISMLVRQVWAGLPQGLSYPTIGADMPNNMQPLLTYTINAPLALQQIMQYSEVEIKQKLASLTGIGSVELSGAEPYQWVIEYNSDVLKSFGLSEWDIKSAVYTNNAKDGLGLANITANPSLTGSNTTVLPVQLQTQKTNSLLEIPIKNVKGHIVYLKEVAQLKHQEAKPNSYYRINGLNTISLTIYAQPNQNQIAVGNRVKETISIIKQNLPKGYSIENSYDSNEYVEREISNISWRFFTALGLLLIFVFIIYRQPKYLFLIATTFVVNLSIASIFYYLFKIEIHLYSLAGITVSLGLMTDNIIVMADHLRNRGNRTVWMALLAGTMAMASTLVIIFFLDDQIKANLTDFALIVIVNQTVSLITALFFVPSLMKLLNISKVHKRISQAKSKFITRFKVALVKVQRSFYALVRKWKLLFIATLVLGFGLPIFMLPSKWEGDKWYNSVYNSTLGSDVYTNSIKPISDKVLGGSLRLFVNNVNSGSYFNQNTETSLSVNASLPHGSTIEHANILARDMENYLTQFKEIRTFQTSVSARQISTSIYFKKEYQNDGFPYKLKGLLISKALELGGAYWSVYGFGDGFNNESRENAGNNTIRMLGYNYETLLSLASSLKNKLVENPRIKEVFIQSEVSYFKPDNSEFVIKMSYEKAILAGLNPYQLFAGLKEKTLNNDPFASLYHEGNYENIVLKDTQSPKNDVWSLNRIPINQGNLHYNFMKFCTIEKEISSQSVCKENQQYSIYLQFDYIGTERSASKYIEKTVEDYQTTLPLGYTVKNENNRWYWSNGMNRDQYLLIALIMVIIFFIGAVLFESLLYPFAVILMIPISFIGIFLTFFLFDLNFDQGGFAAFILLCGITVSAAMYIINDYSVLHRKHRSEKPNNMRLYLKAFQYKIIPILLTLAATFLGFVPFLIGEKQPFWFTMAAGVCGGLVFTLLGIVIYLPLFLGIKERTHSYQK